MKVKDVPVDLVACKYCCSLEVVKFGYSSDGEQRYWCKKCEKAFLDNYAVQGMRISIRQLGNILERYYNGTLLKEVRRQLEQQYQLWPSRSSIYRWLSRFTNIATEQAGIYTPKVGDVWITDETEIKLSSKTVWFWDIMDSKTRFLLASYLLPIRRREDVSILMKAAVQRAQKTPRLVLTDKLQAYLGSIKPATDSQVDYLPSKGFMLSTNTGLINRFHESLENRSRVMRGIKDTKTAKLLLNGWLVHYNFFCPQSALGDHTPGEKAGILYPHKNWLEVVKSQAYPEEES